MRVVEHQPLENPTMNEDVYLLLKMGGFSGKIARVSLLEGNLPKKQGWLVVFLPHKVRQGFTVSFSWPRFSRSTAQEARSLVENPW